MIGHMVDDLRLLNEIDARIQRDLADYVWEAVCAADAAPFERTSVDVSGRRWEPRCEMREYKPPVSPRSWIHYVPAPVPPQLCPHRPATDEPVRARYAPGVDVHGGRVPGAWPFAISEDDLRSVEPDLMSLVREQLSRAVWNTP